MTAAPKPIDLYWSFRSPYSYLATQNIRRLEARRNVTFNLKIVMRLAQLTDQPLAMPNPDPIIQDMETAKIAEVQPHIWRLSRLGLAATDAGKGLAFVDEVSRIIWSGQAWTDQEIFEGAIARAGLTLTALEKAVDGNEDAFDARFEDHDKDLRKAGHWGVPTCVVDREPFFGMDRLPVLEWRLDQMGIG